MGIAYPKPVLVRGLGEVATKIEDLNANQHRTGWLLNQDFYSRNGT